MKTKKIVSLVLVMVMALSFSSLFVTAAEGCYIGNAISQTITGAPTMDGSVSIDEYGTPVIVTSQADAQSNAKVSWTKMSTPENADQKAKIYMTYDQTYLYVAATLDHAQANRRTDAGGGYHPHLAVTLSQKVGNGVFKSNGSEVYLFARAAYKGVGANFTQDYFSARYRADKGGANGANSTLASVSGTKGTDFFVAYDEEAQTYTYEMRIAWANAPGLKDGANKYSGADFAMALELADGSLGDGRAPSYYQIGGNAPQQGVFNSTVNPHGENVVTFASAGQFRVSGNVAPMPNTAPVADGAVADGEYGAPIIITSQKHATTVSGDQINWTEKKTPANSAQQAKIYMTNDSKYLYIAATLDNATKDLWTTTGSGGNHPHLAITASKLVDGGVLKDGDSERYLFSRVHVGAASTAVELWAVDRPSGANKGVTYDARYENGTYCFEMKIAWATIPGLADGNGDYTGDTLAITMELADGVEEDKQLEGSYYTIGGTAARQGNWNTAAPHGTNVMAITCNTFPSDDADASVVETADELISALNDAEVGEVVTLGADIAAGDITINNGITLDLNGCVLTADSVTVLTATTFIKDTGDGLGGIRIAKDKLVFAGQGSNNNQLPLYDEDTYRFFSCEPNQLSGDTNCRFGFQFAMSDDAYDLLADPNGVGIILENYMELTKDGAAPIGLVYSYKTENISLYAENKKNEPAKNWAIILTVTGFEKVNADEVTLTSVPTFVSSTGVKIAAELAEYSYQRGE